MGKIYNTQDSVRIELSYVTDITADIASVVIKYASPTGVIGQLSGAHVPAEKKVTYNFPKGFFLNEVGEWRFWLFATMTDGRVIPGEVHFEEIYEEGAE